MRSFERTFPREFPRHRHWLVPETMTLHAFVVFRTFVGMRATPSPARRVFRRCDVASLFDARMH
jgi:hypothetical protein